MRTTRQKHKSKDKENKKRSARRVAKKELVVKTMPYTASAYKAAEYWLHESAAVDVLMLDPADVDAMVESLAEAMHKHAESEAT
jgi:hypothetical protein